MKDNQEIIYQGELPADINDPLICFENKTLNITEDDKIKLLEKLNKFLSQYQLYEYTFAKRAEHFRQYLEEGKTATFCPAVRLGLTIQQLQLIDPTNGIFSVQCEASVGISINETVTYLRETGIEITTDDIIRKVALGGIIWFEEKRIEDRLDALLRLRLNAGEFVTGSAYYRYGKVTQNIWFIQNFTAKIHHKADFQNMPNDSFMFNLDLAVGLGGDVNNVTVIPEVGEYGPTTLFSPHYSSGEYCTDQSTAKLTALSFLPDPSCFFSNIIRLSFHLRRYGQGVLFRIVCPLIILILFLIVSSYVIRDKVAMCTGLIPTILLSVVALKITTSQDIPRGAPFSRLDKVFLISYLVIIAVFSLILLEIPQHTLMLIALAFGYLVSCFTILRKH